VVWDWTQPTKPMALVRFLVHPSIPHRAVRARVVSDPAPLTVNSCSGFDLAARVEWREQLRCLARTLQVHRAHAAGGRSVEARRALVMSRDAVRGCTRQRQLQRALAECKRMARQPRRRGGVTTAATPLAAEGAIALATKLGAVAMALGLQPHMDVGTSTMTLSNEHMLVDVSGIPSAAFDLAAAAAGVKCVTVLATHHYGQSVARTHCKLLQALRRCDWPALQNVLALEVQRAALSSIVLGSGPNAPTAGECLAAVEADVRQLVNAERDAAFVASARLLRGHGLLSADGDDTAAGVGAPPLRLRIYAEPSAQAVPCVAEDEPASTHEAASLEVSLGLERHDSRDGVGSTLQASSWLLGAPLPTKRAKTETAGVTAAVATSTTPTPCSSLLQIDWATPQARKTVDCSIADGKLHLGFSIQLSRPVAVCAATLGALRRLSCPTKPGIICAESIGSGPQDSKQRPAFAEPNAGAMLLCPVKPDCQLRVLGRRQRFIAEGEGGMRGFVVERLPCTSVLELLGTIQLLRQQVVFNQLYSSCFEQPAGLGQISVDHDAEVPTFEVLEPTLTAPAKLRLRFFDANAQRLRGLALDISPGGIVSPTLSALPSAEAESLRAADTKLVDKMASMLAKCHILPIVFRLAVG
jgi:hypothetical protein